MQGDPRALIDRAIAEHPHLEAIVKSDPLGVLINFRDDALGLAVAVADH